MSDGGNGDGKNLSVLVAFDSDGSPWLETAVAMNTKLVAVVLLVALVATGIGTGLAVLLSR